MQFVLTKKTANYFFSMKPHKNKKVFTSLLILTMKWPLLRSTKQPNKGPDRSTATPLLNRGFITIETFQTMHLYETLKRNLNDQKLNLD